jgi:hypothetical protein
MKSSFFTRLLYKHGDSLLASFVGFIIIYLFARHGGVGISPDSVAYISTARNFADGDGFVLFDGKPLVAFPLFYPLFLASVMTITQLDILSCTPLLNGIMFALVIFLSGILMSRFTAQSRIYKIVLLTVITLSPALIEIYSMLWSETLFILLTLIFFFSLRPYLVKLTVSSLILSAVVVAMAFDTRFVGITLVATGFILIVLNRETSWKTRLLHSTIFSFTSCSLVAINLVRNAVDSEHLTGPRQKGITPLSDNIAYSARIFSEWSSLKGVNYMLEIALCVGVMLFFAWLLYLNWDKAGKYKTYENVVIVFFIVYVSFIIVTSTISRYEQINNRLLSPAFLPFIWGMSHKIPSLIKRIEQRKYQWQLSIVFAIVYGLVCIGYFSINADNYSFMKDSGIPGYTEDTWKESPTIKFLKQNATYFRPDSMVYSNHNQAVYLYTNYAVDMLPEKAYKSDVKMFMDESPIVLIWFNLEPNSDLLSLQDIMKRKNLKVLHEFADGTIYKVTNIQTKKKRNYKKRYRFNLLSQKVTKEAVYSE